MTHFCHWPGCENQVPPEHWGCKKHWFELPKRIRDKLWRTYRAEQGAGETPGNEYLEEYLEAASEALSWINGDRAPLERFYMRPVDRTAVAWYNRHKYEVIERREKYGDEAVTKPVCEKRAQIICKALNQRAHLLEPPS